MSTTESRRRSPFRSTRADLSCRQTTTPRAREPVAQAVRGAAFVSAFCKNGARGGSEIYELEGVRGRMQAAKFATDQEQ